MDHKNTKGTSENILLLIIAVTLLVVKLSDGIMVHQGETLKTDLGTTPSQVVKLSETKPKAKKIFTFGIKELNGFTAEELAQINGIGPVLAKRIVDYRKKHGGIKKITELRNIKGIGPKKYAMVMKQYR